MNGSHQKADPDLCWNGNLSIPAGVKDSGPRSDRPPPKGCRAAQPERLCEVPFHRPRLRANARTSASGESSCRPEARPDNKT